MSDNKLIEYNKEIQPLIRKLLEKKEALKEWAKDDPQVQEFVQEIKSVQESMKDFIADKEATLVREIADLENDIKLAIKGATKGTAYKPAELRAYMTARAKDNVEKVVSKGELFVQLGSELK